MLDLEPALGVQKWEAGATIALPLRVPCAAVARWEVVSGVCRDGSDGGEGCVQVGGDIGGIECEVGSGLGCYLLRNCV